MNPVAGTLAAGAGSQAGPIGLVLILLIGLVTVLLIRNMDKRLRRLPRDFPADDRAATVERGPEPPAAA